MRAFEYNILNSFIEKFDPKSESDPEKFNGPLPEWLIVLNEKCFVDKPIPIKSIKSDSEMIKLWNQYESWQHNRELILQRIIHRMTHIWFWLYGDNDLYRSWFHGKPFINLMASYGIFCDTKGRHTGVSEQFWRIIREIFDPYF